jgi:ABC-2 type transport system permease protein
MLRSVYLKTLRDMRWGIVGWGGGLGVLLLFTAAGWSIAYPDAASRAQIAAQIESGGLSVAQVFYGPPRHIDTVGGFVEWRALGLAPVLLGLYLILSATGMTRGAEESRTIEVVAATPTTRIRLLLQQVAALVTAIALTCALLGVVTLPAGLAAREPTPDPVRVAGASANVAAAALMFGAVGLLAAQFFPRRRNAALAATGAMVLCHFANTLPLAVAGIRWLRYVSPLYLYTSSSPLADGHMDWIAFAAMLAITAAISAIALAASQRRDLFDTLHGRRTLTERSARPVTTRTGPARPQLFLRSSLGRGLRDAIPSSAAWAAGLGSLAVLLTALVPNMRTALLERPSGGFFRELVTERALLSALLFSFLLPPLVATFGVTLGASWASDEMGQRLELELSAPVPRWSIFAQRLVAAVIAEAVVIGLIAAGIGIAIEIGGVDVPLERIAATSAVLFLLAAAAVAVSFAIASWRPGVAAAAAGAFVAVSFFGDLVLPLLGLPDWVRYVTIFGLYGAPLEHGVTAWRVATLAAATLALGIAGAVSFQRKDIAK